MYLLPSIVPSLPFYLPSPSFSANNMGNLLVELHSAFEITKSSLKTHILNHGWQAQIESVSVRV